MALRNTEKWVTDVSIIKFNILGINYLKYVFMIFNRIDIFNFDIKNLSYNFKTIERHWEMLFYYRIWCKI